MPEGPEIRRAADTVAKALVGKPVEEVFFAFDHLAPYANKFVGRTVTAVDTYGKAMLTRFDNGLNIYSHNQLYGKWVIRKARDLPTTKRQLRLAIHNAEKSALLYSASEIEVVRDDAVAAHPFMGKIGPDLLDPQVTVEQVLARFVNDKFKRRGFPSLLLDQTFLAGLGNYLRSEALFVAQIWPQHRPIDCTYQQIERLAHACIDLTRQSYRTNGITNDLALVEELKAGDLPFHRYRFRVFNREDEPCWTCGTPIVKAVLGGRRLYYCPLHQRAA
jgi:endonuclease-8